MGTFIVFILGVAVGAAGAWYAHRKYGVDGPDLPA